MSLRFSKEVKLFILNALMFLISSFSSIYIFINVEHDGYIWLFTQPLAYFLVFMFFLSNKLFKLNNNLFYIVFIGVSFIRYVLLPFFVVYSGYYGGRSPIPPMDNSFSQAILLMNFELIFVSLLINFLHKKNKRIEKNHIALQMSDKHDGYYMFIFITAMLIFLFPHVLSEVNFIVPSSNSLITEMSIFDNIILYCLIVSKQLIFIILIKKAYLKYEVAKNELWILISVVILILNISIYFGTNRMDIVISSLVSIFVLKKLYSKKLDKYLITVIPVIFFLFFIVTQERDYASISGGSSNIIDFTDTLQTYTGGVYNVAIAIETPKFYPEVKNFKILFMDIFRPMIGLNIFIRILNIPYSNLFFNQRMRPNSSVVSQILPMIGQGYIFFGPVFSILLGSIFIYIQFLLEKIINSTKSLEMFYFVGLSTARIGMLMGQNSMNLINDMSMNLVLFLLVYCFNKYFRFTKSKEVVKV